MKCYLAKGGAASKPLDINFFQCMWALHQEAAHHLTREHFIRLVMITFYGVEQFWQRVFFIFDKIIFYAFPRVI